MTRPQMASCSAKTPPPSARRAPEGLDGPRCPWVAGGRQLETRTVLRRHNTRPPRTAPDHFQYKTRPARVIQPHSRYKIRPAHPSSPHARYKTRPARPKWPFLARFSRAGRTFYRFRQQEAAHGELCTVCEAETELAITAHQPSPARHRRDRRTRLRCPWTAPTPPPTKFRMQFDWKKFQQCLKTLQFQRC